MLGSVEIPEFPQSAAPALPEDRARPVGKNPDPCHSVGDTNTRPRLTSQAGQRIATRVNAMRSILTKLAPLFGFVAIAACQARTPLDSMDEDELYPPTGGSGGDGYPGTGGTGGLANTGGSVHVGGSGGHTGGSMTGGSTQKGGQTGGSIPTGGSGYGGSIVSGGRGGNVGGFLTGGSTQNGGQTTGGNTQKGGQTGGTPPTGGSGYGGSIFSGGAGGGAGGTAGSAGKDGGFGGSAGGSKTDGGRDVIEIKLDARPTGGAPGSGGAIATGGTGGSVACEGLASNEELIDDLNDGDHSIPRLNGRLGAWEDGNDGTPGGEMSPDPKNTFVPNNTGDPCRKYAVYVKGTGFTDNGAWFWVGLGAPYDASRYTGISFWAKVDPGTTPSLTVSFPDKDTSPDAGICKPNGNGPNQCYDHYHVVARFTSTWTKYTISFKDLYQGGWGMQGTAFDPASLYQILFKISENATFGVWIDDIAFTM
jgi:hypothetical protein